MNYWHPEALWLLILLVPLLWLQLRSRSGRRGFHRFCLTLIRSLIPAILVFALAAPILHRRDESRTHVVVADISESMQDADIRETEKFIREKINSLPAEDSFKLVVFDEKPELLENYQPALNFLETLRPLRRSLKPGSGSSPGPALELAGGVIDHDGRGSISLFTDGMETRGSVINSACRLAERGIPVLAQPVGRRRENEVIIKSLEIVNHASIGSAVLLQAEILSSEPVRGELEIRSTHEPSVLSVPVLLSGGMNQMTVPLTLDHLGTVSYEAEIRSEKDTLANNNSMSVSLEATRPIIVGVIESDIHQSVEKALRRWLGTGAQVRSVTPYFDASELDNLQLLVIADTPSQYIAAQSRKAIPLRVANGLGLLVTGGRQSFGPGGYAGTELAEILPVQFSQTAERRDPSTTLVIIIDTSGSMTGSRVNLAKEIARLAMARLKPHDKVGIVEFYGSKRWAAPIQSASNVIDLQRALNRLSAGGGTVILPAIEEAFYALLNVKTRTRHVLVLTDGGVESGAFEPLIRKMAEKGITLSTVLIGPDTHSSFLSSLSQWGHGRFYTASDRFGLPEIIVKQPENSLMSPFLEFPTLLRVKTMSPVLQDINFEAAPALHGYVETQARPTADVLLETELGHPYLARWQFGLGRVAVLTSQLAGDWSGDLVMWDEYPTLIKNLVRSLAAVSPEDALSMAVETGPDGVEIQIDNQIHNSKESLTPLQLTLTDDLDLSRTWLLDPLEPGSWNLRISGLKPGVYHLAANTLSGQLQGKAAFSVNAIPEVSNLVPETERLNKVNQFQTYAYQRADHFDPSVKRPYELWPWLAIAALILFLAEILWRRWPVTGRGNSVLNFLLAGLFFSIGACQAAEAGEQAGGRLDPEIENLVKNAAGLSFQDSIKHFPEICRAQMSARGELVSLVDYLRKQQETPSILLLLAEAAEKSGDLETAAVTFRKLISLYPDSPFLCMRLARTCALQGDSRQARATIEQGLEKTLLPEERLSLQLHRLMLLYSRGDETADDELAILAKEYENEGSVRNFLGLWAGLNGNSALAAALVQVNPGHSGENYYYHLFQGLFHLRSENYEAAAKAYESAYENAILERDRLFALERRISTARIAGQLEMLVETWLGEENLSADKTAALVMILRELGRSEDILQFWQRCPETSPSRKFMQSPEFQNDFISICLETGREQQAESIYLKLVEAYPERLDYLISLVRLKLLNEQTAQAKRIYEEAIDKAVTEYQLLSLAEGAAGLALDDLALAASNKLQALSDSGHIRAMIFRAKLLRERGDSDSAVKLLRLIRLETDTQSHFAVMLAETFERMGYLADALSIYQNLYRDTKTEDILLHIAWLLEETGQTDQAYGLWLELWQNTEVAARLKQAQQRLLDIASRTGKLAELAFHLEQRLDAGTATDRELEMLVQIYETANDPVSAAEVLMEFSRSERQPFQMLERLVRVYLACEQFGRADAVLKNLMVVDPDNVSEYLQQRALIALERRQPHQVRAILAQLEKVAPSEKIVDEFSAGVLDMVGQHQEAAARYERLMAQYPDRIESLLHWANAMKALGEGKKAVIRFEILLENAAEDDLFTVAVDGLLNLNAPTPTMRRALQRVFLRMAANPGKVFLYQLAADILESLGKEAQMADVMEMAAGVAGERRSQMLRELMDLASVNGWNDRQIDYGRALLILGDEMPPQVFLSLGEALVRHNELHEAEKAFNRALIEGDYNYILQQVASFYEQAGLPADADRVIRNLLITQPDDITLLIRSGIYREQQGSFTTSFVQYRRAVELMLGRMPMVTDVHSAASGGNANYQKVFNKDEVERYFNTAASGLLGTIRSPELQKEFNEFIFQRITQEMNTLAGLEDKPESMGGCLRLVQLAKFARQYAFSFHQPDLADDIDKRLLEVFPRDGDLRQEIISSRVNWGLFDRALPFTKETTQPMPTSLLLWNLLQHPEDISGRKGEPADSLGTLVETLVLMGNNQEARAVIRDALSRSEEVDAAASTMMDASLVLEDKELFSAWLDRRVNRIWKLSTGKEIALELEMLLRQNWNFLSSGQQRDLMEKLLSQCSSSGLKDRIYLDAFCFTSGFVEKDPEMPPKLLQTEAEESLKLDLLKEWLPLCEPNQQLAVLQAIISSQPVENQRQFIMELTGGWFRSFETATMDVLEQRFLQAPPLRLTAAAGYSMLVRNGWNRNPHQGEMGRRLGEILLNGTPHNVAVLMAAAIARENAQLHDQAVLLFDEALDLILARTEPDFQDQIMLSDAVRILSPDDIETILSDLDLRQSVEGASPMLLFCKGILHDAAERNDEAGRELSNAFQLAPANRPISRRLIDVLENNGRKVMLARLLSKTLTKSSIMESYEWRKLTSVNFELANPLAALDAAQKDASPLGIIWVMRLNHEMGMNSRLLTLLRKFITTCRNDAKFFSPFWPDDASAGGMTGWLLQQEEKRADQPRLFQALTDLPDIRQEYAALIQAAPPERRDIPGLISGLVASAVNHRAAGELIKSLEDSFSKQAMNAKDQIILWNLIEMEPNAVPLPFLNQIYGSLVVNATPRDLENLARLYLMRGDLMRSRSILNWLIIRELRSTGRPGIEPDGFFHRVDDYLATLPENQREACHLRILNLLAVTPFEKLHQGLDVVRLQRLGQLHNQDYVEKEVGILAQKLEADPAPENYPRLWKALFRFHAIKGNDAECVRILKTYLTFNRLDRETIREKNLKIDFRDLLAWNLNDPDKFLSIILSHIEENLVNRQISSAMAVKSICLLSQWLSANGFKKKAITLNEKALSLAGETGEHWLWIADAYALAGQARESLELQERLFQADLLPVTRFQEFFAQKEQNDGAASTQLLAIRAAQYSNCPEVLIQAIKNCRDRKDEHLEKALKERFRKNWPEKYARYCSETPK